jgi:alpha-D-ribose 1-methylphosphonate 5-triphosphate synthase subunit PhnI
VRGGTAAIQAAEKLYHSLNQGLPSELVANVARHLPYLLDRVMGEASLWAPELAALAITQTGGDLYEAVLLLRAYRSTVPRLAYAEPVGTSQMLTVRRISAAFKEIPGGQILGPTLDYSHRVLHTEVIDGPAPALPEAELADRPAAVTYPAVADWHRLNGLLEEAPRPNDTPAAELPDVTREPITFPASRPSSAIAGARRYGWCADPGIRRNARLWLDPPNCQRTTLRLCRGDGPPPDHRRRLQRGPGSRKPHRCR